MISSVLRLKKRFGQHLLKSQRIHEHLIEALDPQKDDIVFEIGPGSGNLTEYLLKTNISKIIGYEIEGRLYELLEKRFPIEINNKRLNILQNDVLDDELPNNCTKCIGNIPYCISSLLIKKFIQNTNKFNRIVLLVQDEFAQKLYSNSKNIYNKKKLKIKGDSKGYFYSKISVMAQLNYKIMKGILISPKHFSPPPKVESRIITLEPLINPIINKNNYIEWNQFLSICFMHKKKKLRNTLLSKSLLNYFNSYQNDLNISDIKDKIENILNEMNIKDQRPFHLSPNDYINLMNLFHSNNLLFSNNLKYNSKKK